MSGWSVSKPSKRNFRISFPAVCASVLRSPGRCRADEVAGNAMKPVAMGRATILLSVCRQVKSRLSARAVRIREPISNTDV